MKSYIMSDEEIEVEEGYIQALDSGYTFFPKVSKERADKYNIGDRVVIDLVDHVAYLRIGTVMREEHGRLMVVIDRSAITMFVHPDDVISLNAARIRQKYNPRVGRIKNDDEAISE